MARRRRRTGVHTIYDESLWAHVRPERERVGMVIRQGVCYSRLRELRCFYHTWYSHQVPSTVSAMVMMCSSLLWTCERRHVCFGFFCRKKKYGEKKELKHI